MKTSDYISSALSVIAIVISLLVWRTADTRESELRAKTVKYSVESHGQLARWTGGKTKTGLLDLKVSRFVNVLITDDGSQPVSGVTLSVSRNSSAAVQATVDLVPPIDHEAVQMGNLLIVRLKNPLGVKEQVKVNIAFTTQYETAQSRAIVDLKQAYVDSEVGAATLVASLDEKPSSDPGKPTP
jgi:hypothetical protein